MLGSSEKDMDASCFPVGIGGMVENRFRTVILARICEGKCT